MGIGKSAGVEEFARHMAEKLGMEFVKNGWEEGKFGFIDTRLSQYEPTDLRGVPVPDLKTGTTNWLKPTTIPKGKSMGIWFFDELNLANHSVQAAAYQIIRDRQIDDTKIPEGWLIVAAGNTSEDKANVFDMPAPLSNRFTHATLMKPTAEEWVEWAAPKGVHKDVISYLQFKPSHIHTFNPENDDDAFATHRTWEMVSDNLKTAEKLEFDPESEYTLIASCIGEGVAKEFVAYRKMSQKLDIDKILKKGDDYEFPDAIDVRYALVTALAERYAQNPKQLADIIKIWKRCSPEFTIVSLKLAKAYRPKTFGRELIKLKEWTDLATDYSKYLT